MKVYKKYSHLNGEEYLLVHKSNLYQEILNVISLVDANNCKTKVSKERGRKGELLYNPTALNAEFKTLFDAIGWQESRRDFFVSDKYEHVKVIDPLPANEQKEYLLERGEPIIPSYNQTDFVKEGVSVEIQFGKYFAVTYDTTSS